MNRTASILACFLLAACGGSGPPDPPVPAAPESAPPADPVPREPPSWRWNENGSDLESAIPGALADLSVERGPAEDSFFGDRTLLIRGRNGAELKIPVHAKTPLRRQGDRLYVAAYHRMSSGCEVVAYDLAAGKEIWRKELQGLGPIEHSKYGNLVTLDLEGGWLVVRSTESAGRYIECLSPADGAQLHHRVLPRGE